MSSVAPSAPDFELPSGFSLPGVTLHRFACLSRARSIPFVFLRDEEGGICVVAKSIPGLVTQGENLDDAIANASEAAELFFEVHRESQTEPPHEDVEIVGEVVAEKWLIIDG